MSAEDPAAQILRDARRLLVLSGAGLSTASGIPDFRSPGGIWSRFDPREFHIAKWRADPAGYWRLRARLMEELDLPNVAPNAAHRALADASHSERYHGHVTQNIDGLLPRAGHEDSRLVEIHGSAAKVRCLACDQFFPYATAHDAIERGILPPPCPACSGPLKPGSILFGEGLSGAAWTQAESWARTCDVLLVAGSSLEVMPVASLPAVALARGARLILVNATATDYDDEADAIVRAPLELSLPALFAAAGFGAGAIHEPAPR